MAEQSPGIGNSTEAAYMRRDLFAQGPVPMDAQGAHVTGGADTEGKTPEQIADDFLLKVLNGDIPGFPKFSDLPSLWKETPAESSDASYPGISRPVDVAGNLH